MPDSMYWSGIHAEKLWIGVAQKNNGEKLMNSLKNYILAIISISLFSVASFAQEIRGDYCYS